MDPRKLDFDLNLLRMICHLARSAATAVGVMSEGPVWRFLSMDSRLKRSVSLLSPRLGAGAGIVMLVLGLGLPSARAGSGFKDIASFAEGTVANLFIVVEYQPDGSRSINVRFNRSPLGSSLFFHRDQWQVFAGQLGQAKGAPEGVEQKFPDLPAPGGSLLRMSFVRRGGEISLTLINQPDQGDSYPPVPFHLAPADFVHLQQAMVEAAKAEIIVGATSAAEFARFRADLGTRFTPEQLQDFDTAIEELQLDAMNRGKATAADREADMLSVVDRKTFPDAVLLGWRARRVRILREFPEVRRLVDQDTAEAAKTAATGTPESITRRLASEKQALDKLRRDRDDTLRRLNELSHVIGRPE